MKVTFGINLDGFEHGTAPCVLDSITCGPMGLLDLLETRLGLKEKQVSRMQRVLQLKSLIEKLAASRDTFYRRSLEKDPLAVASTLLQWRDDFVEAGWDGTASVSDSQRLQDLAAIEAQLAGNVAPGIGDRLSAALRELNSRSAEIESLTVLDPPEHLSPLWQRLCQKLGAEYRPVDSGLGARQFNTNSDLGAIQAILANPSAGLPRKLHLRDDGSLLCLTAHSEVTLAQASAQWLRAVRHDSQTTLIAGHDASILDRALLALDEPMLGLQPRSVARPVPQLLLLALRLRWKPLNPRALLEFLTHPVCPVTGRLRYRLAESVAASPGVGGPKWNDAAQAARTSARQLSDAAATREALKRIDDDLAHWLLCERFDEKAGAPGLVLSECCAQVARWAGARSGTADLEAQAQFMALASPASELADLLRPLSKVTRVQLEHIVRETTSWGWIGTTSPAELDHVHRVSTPAGVIEPTDNVVWWDFSKPASTPRLPWTETEQIQLAAHGARFPAPEVVAAQTNADWMRALMAARNRLILVVPRQRGGEPVARHPLHTRLIALVDGAALPTLDLDRELTSGHATSPLRFATIQHRPLPPLRRWWKLSSGVRLAPRDRESYSSLDKFIYSPYAWVLRYKARLEAGQLAGLRLQSDSNLKGTLLHRLLDLLLAAPAAEIDWRSATQPALDQWLEGRWQPLLEQEGATLLLPGKVADAAALLASGKMALWELIQQMRAAKVINARSNISLTAAPFHNSQLEGIVDLLVENREGRQAVLDLKFGGLRIREKELRENRALQLAVYGCLLNQQHKAWPAAGFYILTLRRLIAQDDSYFSRARVISPESPPGGLKRCWSDFQKIWRWRRQQLEVGWIEITADGTDPADGPPDAPESVPPLPHWQATEDHAKYNEYDALTGWRADA